MSVSLLFSTFFEEIKQIIPTKLVALDKNSYFCKPQPITHNQKPKTTTTNESIY